MRDVIKIHQEIFKMTDPGGHAAKGVGLRPLACWDCGFKSRRGH